MKRRTVNKQYHRRHPTRRANGVYALCGRTVEEFMHGGNIGHDKQTYFIDHFSAVSIRECMPCGDGDSSIRIGKLQMRRKESEQQNGGNEDVED